MNDWVELPPDSMPLGNAISLSFWAFGGDRLPASTSVFYAADASRNRLLHVHLPFENGYIYFDCGNQGTSSDDRYYLDNFNRIYKPAHLEEYRGQWSHWTFTKDITTGTMEIYLNGELWHRGTGRFLPLSKPSYVRLGCDVRDNGLFYHGRLAEVQLWEYARTEIEIRRDMYRNLQGNELGLRAYWPLNEGRGNIVYDKTRGANHGRVYGGTEAAWVVTRLPIVSPTAQLEETAESRLFSWQELQNQALQLSLQDRWYLVHALMNSIQQQTLPLAQPAEPEMIPEPPVACHPIIMPVGWWPLHDENGRLTDRLGQSGGVVAGAVPRTHPQSNQLEPKRSLYFPRGTSATISTTPALNVGTGNFSICLWAKTDDHCGVTEVLLDKRVENSGPVRGWCVFLYNGQLGFQIADGNWTNFALVTSGQQAEVDGNWHHLAITIDRAQEAGGRWYVDGREVGTPFSVRHRSGSLSNQIPLTLGRRSDAGEGLFQGYLSDIRLYQRALTAEEVYQVYSSISVDEQAARTLVSPFEDRAAAGSIENSEPLPLLDGVERIETIPEPPVTHYPISTPDCVMLPNCQTCQFHSPPRYHSEIEIGCAVNPLYWSEWRQARSTGNASHDSDSLMTCRDYEAIT